MILFILGRFRLPLLQIQSISMTLAMQKCALAMNECYISAVWSHLKRLGASAEIRPGTKPA